MRNENDDENMSAHTSEPSKGQKHRRCANTQRRRHKGIGSIKGSLNIMTMNYGEQVI